MPKDLHELPKVRDGLSYLYLEHCRIEKDEQSIAAFDEGGMTRVPVATLSLLMLGPGTNVTHDAVKVIADNGCLVIWCGENGVRFYAQGPGETRKASKLLAQAQLSCDPEGRLEVIKKMYWIRFPDKPVMDKMTLEEMRGLEGVRVRAAYARASKQHGVTWEGRSYKRESWQEANPVNRALSAANSCLYGICHAAIVAGGYSPGLGFIHTGKQLSFVYDVADIYKVDLSVPTAFEIASQGREQVERRVRIRMRDVFREQKLLARIIPDIDYVLGISEKEQKQEDDYDGDAALPAPLYGEKMSDGD